MTVTPEAAIQRGSSFTVEVAFQGRPKTVAAPGLGFEVEWVKYETGIFAAGQPWGLSAWYPLNEHASDKASYTIIVTVPDPYEVAAVDELVDVVDHGEETTYTWEARDEVASYFVAIAVVQFHKVTTEGPEG